MPSSLNADNGVVSGTAGLKSSADNSGVLDLQTNGTTAISISASQVVTFANQPAYTGGTANGVLYLNASKVLTSGSALVFDGTNLGLGVTPSGNSLFESISGGAQKNIFQAWYGSSNNLPFAIATDNANGHAYLGWNTKQGASATQTYLVNNWANKLEVSSGQFRFYIAASGTAGNTITFTQPMTLDSTGALFINRASNGVHLQTQVNSVNTAALGSFNGAPTVGSNLTGYSGIMFNGASFEPTLDGLNVRQSALVDIGSTNYRFKTGHFTGINFPATQVASADANTLDDYEEGTFSIAIAPSSGAFGAVTYNASNISYYTKVGRLVSVTGLAWVSSYTTGTASGRMFISLPFASANVTQNFSPGIITQFGGNGFTPSISTANVAVRVEQGLAVFSIAVDNNFTYADEQIGTFSTSGFFFRFNVTYISA